MPKLTKINNIEFNQLVLNLCEQIKQGNWQPDYIVGIVRGGLIPAVYMSHYFDVPMHGLKVSLRHGTEDTESNLWMAEDAFGYITKENRGEQVSCSDIEQRKNILIVDDINDTGATFNWIRNDWQTSCMGSVAYDIWNGIWGNNVRFAALVNNETSGFKDVNYSAKTVNKEKDPQWIVFPWEEWWPQ